MQLSTQHVSLSSGQPINSQSAFGLKVWRGGKVQWRCGQKERQEEEEEEDAGVRQLSLLWLMDQLDWKCIYDQFGVKGVKWVQMGHSQKEREGETVVNSLLFILLWPINWLIPNHFCDQAGGEEKWYEVVFSKREREKTVSITNHSPLLMWFINSYPMSLVWVAEVVKSGVVGLRKRNKGTGRERAWEIEGRRASKL